MVNINRIGGKIIWCSVECSVIGLATEAAYEEYMNMNANDKYQITKTVHFNVYQMEVHLSTLNVCKD
jgi:hypothetical protein